MVCLHGDALTAVIADEVRQLPVFGPLGLSWKPRNGDMVLVIQGGTGGQESCVAGAEQKSVPDGLEPGELCLHTEDASIWVRKNGRVEIWGDLYINGVQYKPFVLG